MDHGLRIAWNTLTKMVDGFYAILPNLVIALIVFFLFHILSKFLGNLSRDFALRIKIDRTLAHALGRLVILVTYIFGLLVCASIMVPAFSADKLIAGLGITSVAIGFAFQNILQNFFAGMLLLWQKPFKIGDEIKTKEFEGTVEDITIRCTIMRTYTGEKVFIPNGTLFTDPVTVNTAYTTRQVHLQVPIPEKINDRRALEMCREVLNNMDSIAKEPAPEVYVSALGGTLTLDIFLWTSSRNANLIKTTDEATLAVKRALVAAEQEKKAA